MWLQIETILKSNKKIELCLIQPVQEDILTLILSQWVKWTGRYWQKNAYFSIKY